jgi:cellulose synthase/poly-beta-1,6-N-acetylglucosamine synthase-like glycosyltransferase
MTDGSGIALPQAWAETAALVVNLVVFFYFISLNGLYLLLLIFSVVWCRRYKKSTIAHPVDFEALPYLKTLVPPVTILVPAYNEERVIAQSLRSMLAIGYASIEVIVVNDGSTDQTLAELERAFSLRKAEARPSSELKTETVRDVYISTVEPRLLVVDKPNGGKADALNAGINFCQTPYFLAVDADSLLEGEALRLALRVIFEDPARRVAVGGIVRGVNGSIVDAGRVRLAHLVVNFWVMMQAIEYVRSFLAGRAGWSQMNGLLVVPGAFGLFQRAAVVRAGGYSTRTVTEDLELVVRLHRYAREHGLEWQIVFAPDAVCWTEMPDNARVLSRQRRRWHEGLWQTLALHRSMLFRPRYGVVGILSLPHQAVHELGGPLIELAGMVLLPVFYALGLLSFRALVLYLGLAFFTGILFSIAAFLIDETHFPRHRYPRDALLLLAFSVFEYFGYRQVFMAWRLAATWNYFFGRIAWRVSSRAGFTTKAK